MKVSRGLLNKLEELYSQYEKEIPKAKKDKYFKDNPKKTYLLHNNNFMRWLKHDLESGGNNKEN
ncbi:hypothetical protein [Psychrilyobacter atlanticus]|uniref:hypothetical protein n=1 Tax=Psychrilyobacter atlanticus TaxID=271091 RepID=UPI0003F6167F|nr:hypothetical protein [Psychrilyobacter atlanticus]